MANITRRAHPDCLRYFLMHLRFPEISSNVEDGRENTCHVDKLVATLIEKGGYSATTAEETIVLALSDGLLIPVYASSCGVVDSKIVRLPNSAEVKRKSPHDWYCYECHLPGQLENCIECRRSFHRLCYREKPDRPNYAIPSTKTQVISVPDPVSASTNIDLEALMSAATAPDKRNNRPQEIVDHEVCNDVSHPNQCSSASKQSKKAFSSNEGKQNHDLCTCCRLLKRVNKKNTPNLPSSELCHLLNYTFSTNRQWLTHDIREYLNFRSLNIKEMGLVSALMLYSTLTMDDIDFKIQRKCYNSLTEFFVDLLDIQHNFGVFFGPYSTEMESTKWLIRDVAHDLSEIRHCPDCFRHSQEKVSSIWFAIPCAKRHKLVYAKHTIFPYWPAKVIRSLPNNKYEVIFFGGTHFKAVIDAAYIKPIDSDVKSLNMGSGRTMKKAMEELRFHQMLSKYPSKKFAFNADPHEMDDILRSVVGTNSKALIEKEKRTRLGKRRISAIFNIEEDMAVVEKHNTSKECLQGTKPHSHLDNPQILSVNNCISDEETTEESTEHSTDNNPSQSLKEMLREIAEVRRMINEYRQKNDQMEAQKRKLKETIEKQELERKTIKNKQWCYWCLSEAIFSCCFLASYCSQICQSRHWKEGHSKECNNKGRPQSIDIA
ncbi:zinc finger MYND domain-containing protein 11-like [Haematobia irritans]|uniref:zinc finger MYND domain-containing protein 11-like n=1 Tax=Haematobia irritans TaxID=7368 RepID=UPI003F4FACA5